MIHTLFKLGGYFLITRLTHSLILSSWCFNSSVLFPSLSLSLVEFITIGRSLIFNSTYFECIVAQLERPLARSKMSFHGLKGI